jgi:hypothetical protein
MMRKHQIRFLEELRGLTDEEHQILRRAADKILREQTGRGRRVRRDARGRIIKPESE